MQAGWPRFRPYIPEIAGPGQGYRLLRALRSQLSRILNHGCTPMNTDKCAMQEVDHGFVSDTLRGSRFVSFGVDP